MQRRNELRILNRVIRLTPDGLTFEADPWHADLLAESICLTEANSVGTPGVKEEPDYEAAKHDSHWTRVDSLCLRWHLFLGQHRNVVKQLSRLDFPMTVLREGLEKLTNLQLQAPLLQLRT